MKAVLNSSQDFPSPSSLKDSHSPPSPQAFTHTPPYSHHRLENTKNENRTHAVCSAEMIKARDGDMAQSVERSLRKNRGQV